MQFSISLPIDAIKEKILREFQYFSNLIIKASPGSGKTTRIPLFLLEQTDKMIYILEPRRLAAKLAATQVAHELGEKVGDRVGFMFRYEKAMSSNTRILFLTEGTFLKILSQNKNLEGVGIVILDEFHERHLSTDAALGFTSKLQKEKRHDLKMIVMSATIDTTKLENFLGTFSSTKCLELSSTRFPLHVHYLPNVTSIIQNTLSKKVRKTLEDILEADIKGDILIFLPGMREIRDCESQILSLCNHFDIQCSILHGDQDSTQQESALESSPLRKIILSTNIAESSVTIPGISIVIDSGLQRESSYNFYSGLPEIHTAKISKASATQRAARANRQGPGWCYRLFAELDFEQRSHFIVPEIERSDLSELYLLALDLFALPLDQLAWPEPPPSQSLLNAYELLTSLNAIDKKLKITPIGKSMLQFPLHPRWGRILTEAQKYSVEFYNKILLYLFNFLEEKNKERFFNQLAKKSHSSFREKDKTLEEIILKGYPDRMARSRGNHFFDVITMNGEVLKIAKEIHHEFDPQHELWIVLDLNHKGEIKKCIPIQESWIYDLEPFPINEDILYLWDEKNSRVFQTSRTLIGKIVLSTDKTIPTFMNSAIQKILHEQAKLFIETIKKNREYERLLTLNKIHLNKDIHDLEDVILEQFFNENTHFNEDDKERFTHSYFYNLKELIDPDHVYNLEQDFPMSIQLTDKRIIAINYDHSKDPWIAAFIQDFYGLSQTPVLAKGKIPLTLQLLGPHKRAIQVTKDLSSFWKTTYPQMFKELTREYPRHYWPQNPLLAKPILLKRLVPE